MSAWECRIAVFSCAVVACACGGLAIAIGGKTTHVSRFGVVGDRVWFVEGAAPAGHRRTARVLTVGARSWSRAKG